MARCPVPGRDVPKFSEFKPIDRDKLEIYLKPLTKIKKIYEDDDWIIDLVETDKGPMLRISVFDEKGHWLDETYIKKTDYLKD